MDRIDLHAHTFHSDGTLSPGDVVRLAKESGLRAVAVTDHDTTAGWAEAMEAGRVLGVEVIGGIEVTARFPGRAMHVLAYGCDVRDPGIQTLLRLREIRAGRDARNPRILDRLAGLGCSVSMEDVLAEAKGEAVGRPHIARALVKKGFAPDVRAAFALFLKDGGPAYVATETVEPVQVIATVAAAGGVTVLAHPKQLRLEGPSAAETLVRDLAAAGLGGIEVWHPSHDSGHRAAYLALATAHGLVPSGGSDFHGANKPDVRLGTGDGTIDVGYATWEALRARCASRAA
jgi:predicted metal-dependent phosphoesterase TrpH